MAFARVDIPQEIKDKVRTVLLSKNGGMGIGEFFFNYRKRYEELLDLKKFGLPRMEDFIGAIPDVARLESIQDKVRIFAVLQSDYLARAGSKNGEQASISHQKNGVERNSDHDFSSASESDEIGLEPDDRGQYSVCFPVKKRPSEPLEPLFEEAGQVAEVHETKVFIFVRYTNRESATKALQMFLHLNIRPAKNKRSFLASSCSSVQNKYSNENTKMKASGDFVQEQQKSKMTSPHGDQRKEQIIGEMMNKVSPVKWSESASSKGAEKMLLKSPSGHKGVPGTEMEAYIGNIASVATQEELYALLSKRHHLMKLTFKKKGATSFAFVAMRSEAEVDALVQEFDSMEWHGHRLVVRRQQKKLQNNTSPKEQIKKNSPGDEKKRPFNQVSHIYSMPALESDMPELERDVSMPALDSDMPELESDIPALEVDIPYSVPELEESSVVRNTESHKGKEVKHLIIVENFPDETSERELIALFYRYHPVKATITSSKGCNIAEIQLTSTEDVDKAIVEMNQQVYMDKSLCVSVPPPQAEKDEEEVAFGELLKLRGLIVKQMAQTPPQVQLGQRLEVLVTSVISNNVFWGQIVHPKLEAKLAEISEAINNPSSHSVRNYKHGKCVAVFDVDGLWYRAWVFKLQEHAGKAQVFFMDYGNTGVLSVDKIADFSSSTIWDLCPMAVPFTLTEPVLNLKERELTHITLEVVAHGSEGEEGKFLIARPISLTGMNQILIATAAVRQLTLKRGDVLAS